MMGTRSGFLRRCFWSSTAAAQRGFSLVEPVVATLVVAVLMLGALKGVGAVAITEQTTLRHSQRVSLAQQLLSEISQWYYEDQVGTPVFGPEADEITGTRQAFDDVDDYHGWSESPPAAKNGTPMTDYTGWSRSVSVVWADPANPLNTSATESGLKRVSVTVTDPKGVATTLSCLRASTGDVDSYPDVQSAFTTWVGIELQTGTAPTPVRSGVFVLNQAQQVP